MATLGERIKELRTARGMTQKELSEIMGYKTLRSVQLIESNNTSLDHLSMFKLANLFGVSTDYLIGRSDFPGIHAFRAQQLTLFNDNNNNEPIAIPFINSDADDDGYSSEIVYRSTIKNNDAYVFVVRDDSMIGDHIRTGDRAIIIAKKNEFSSSDICLVSLNLTYEESVTILSYNDHFPSLRRVKKVKGNFLLFSSNPVFEALLLPSSSVNISGLVVEIRRGIKL